jgi:hypothetical protein
MMTDTPDRRRHPGDGTSGSGVRPHRAEPGAEHGRDAPESTDPGQRPPGRIVRTATEARQGEIILGKWGRWIWIGSFALLALLILVLGVWR